MQLEQPLNPNQPLNQPPDIGAFEFDGPPKDDDTALRLTIQDTERAEKYLETRLWMSEWRVAKSLYEAPVKQDYWRDTNVPRAANPYPLCAQHVRALLDASMPALFSEEQPFAMDPNEGTTWQVAQAWEGVLAFQTRDIGFKQQVRLIAKDALIFGTGIGKWGWESYDRKVKKYKRAAEPKKIPSALPGQPPIFVHTAESDDLDLVDVTERVDRPFFKRCEVNHVLVDPSLRVPDIRQAKFVIYRDYLTLRDLNRMRDYEGWKIPSEKELRELAAPPVETAVTAPLETEATAYPSQGHRPMPRYIDSTEDPLDHKLEVLERWAEDSVIVVLNRKLTIRNEGNEFACIPFVSCFWDDIPGTFYGFGIPRRIGSIQTHIQGLRNGRLDDIHLNLQNMWMVKKGTNIAAQPIKAYPGAVFKVDDMESMKPVEKQPILAEAWKEEQVLVSDAEKTTGANELLVQGAQSSGNKSSGLRNATGASAVAGAASSRIQGFIDVIADQVFVPVLNAFASMSRDRMDPAVMRRVIGQTLWQQLEGSYVGDMLIDMVNLSNADLQFSVLAGANLAAKNKLGATFPLEMQLLMTPAAQSGLQTAGMKVNWQEVARRGEQITGWKAEEDLIIPMNQQDTQRSMLNNKNVMNMKATAARLDQMNQHKQQQEAQKNQSALQQIDAKGLAGAGEQIITRAVERSAVKDEEPQIEGDLEG